MSPLEVAAAVSFIWQRVDDFGEIHRLHQFTNLLWPHRYASYHAHLKRNAKEHGSVALAMRPS